MRTAGVLLLALSLGALGSALGATAARAGEQQRVEARQAQTEIPEENLLDVGIEVFKPGLPDEDEVEALDKMEEKGVFEDVRKSEARFIAFHLKNTLQSTGYWGAVRVVPDGADSIDVTVSGEILESTGRKLVLRLRVVDARGSSWLEKKYKTIADVRAYGDNEVGLEDPYQSLYNQIANDILDARSKLRDDEVAQVRDVAKLIFAADLAPIIYGDYLTTDKKGRLKIERLPAPDDPMMDRIFRIRERDYMFVDTLNEYYSDFYFQMGVPYDGWRSYSYEEQTALMKMRRTARLQKILVAIVSVLQVRYQEG